MGTRRHRPPRHTVVGIVLAVLAGTAFSLPAAAGAHRLRIEPGSTRITFRLPATLHTVHGTVRLLSGEVTFDEETGKASGEIVMDATSASTGNARRDRKMHRNVLESARFPTFVFRPGRLDGELPPAGRGRIELSGVLSIHGTDHPLSLPASVDRDGDRLHVKAEFEIPYVKWGLRDPSVFLLRVAKVVTVTVEFEGRLAPGARAPSGVE